MGKTFRKLDAHEKRKLEAVVASGREAGGGRSQLNVEGDLKAVRAFIQLACRKLDADMAELARYGVHRVGTSARLAGGEEDIKRTDLYRHASKLCADLETARSREARLRDQLTSMTDRSHKVAAKLIRGQYRS